MMPRGDAEGVVPCMPQKMKDPRGGANNLSVCDKCRLQTGRLYIMLPLPLLIAVHKKANGHVI